MSLQVVTAINEMSKISSRLIGEGIKIALVPTMGFLHDGHLSLIKEAKKHADIVVVSIFINPTQFAPNEDLDKYPRDLERDIQLLEKMEVDFLFHPQSSEIYSDTFSTYVSVNDITTRLEGATRPTHFRGVTTIVSILFNVVKPHVAVFGQKDAQQVAVLKKMVKDLHYDLNMIVSPIVREPDGLAMSSRNKYLNETERQEALVLSKAIHKAHEMIAGAGERQAVRITTIMKEIIASASSSCLDYITIVDEDNFEEVSSLENGHTYYVLIACKIGNTRLIDNERISL